MIKLEELKGKELKEVQELLQKDTESYTTQVNDMDSEGLNDQEALIVTALDDYDAHLSEVKYKLPKNVHFNDANFTKQDISNRIVEFVNRQEVEWSYSLGMLQTVQFWKKIGREQSDSYIDYKIYDSILRLLGSLKYKGYEEWESILAINEYLGETHEQYTRDTVYLIYLSKLHSIVLDKMQKINNPEPIMETEQV